MDGVWNTKFGPRRVRQEPPTLEEAVIAAALMDLPVEQVRAAVSRAAARRKQQIGVVGVTARGGAQRAVVVERKAARRPGIPRRFSV
jgi:hypothetical protein